MCPQQKHHREPGSRIMSTVLMSTKGWYRWCSWRYWLHLDNHEKQKQRAWSQWSTWHGHPHTQTQSTQSTETNKRTNKTKQNTKQNNTKQNKQTKKEAIKQENKQTNKNNQKANNGYTQTLVQRTNRRPLINQAQEIQGIEYDLKAETCINCQGLVRVTGSWAYLKYIRQSGRTFLR